MIAVAAGEGEAGDEREPSAGVEGVPHGPRPGWATGPNTGQTRGAHLPAIPGTDNRFAHCLTAIASRGCGRGARCRLRVLTNERLQCVRSRPRLRLSAISPERDGIPTGYGTGGGVSCGVEPPVMISKSMWTVASATGTTHTWKTL